jgi:hypothetical protein
VINNSTHGAIFSFTQVAACILAVDPHLHVCYRFFGTYLLQSSFLFLILAQKLGNSADDYIFDNVRTHLHALEAFVRTVNIGYQRTFARVLRRTLAKYSRENGHAEGSRSASVSGLEDPWVDEFDPEMLKYRWTAGYSGLWIEGGAGARQDR